MFEKLSLCNKISLKLNKKKIQIYALEYTIDHLTPGKPLSILLTNPATHWKLYWYSVNLTWQFTCIKPDVIRTSGDFFYLIKTVEIKARGFVIPALWYFKSGLPYIISGTCKIDPYGPLYTHVDRPPRYQIYL